MLLDFVRPRGSDRADPGHDDMVRQWYRATAAWMQLREDHDKLHLDRARAIFPDDPDILFLSACQRETYAGVPIQTAVRSAVLPTGVTLDVGSERVELRRGRRICSGACSRSNRITRRRACATGACSAGLAKHAEAAAELRRAVGELDRSPAAVLRRAVPRRGRGGARQPRRRARRATSRPRSCFRRRSRRCSRSASSRGAPAIATARCARSIGCSRCQARTATSTTIRGGGTTSRRRATPTTCSTRCSSRILAERAAVRRAADDVRSRCSAVRRRGGRAQQSPAFSSKVEAVRVDVLVTDNGQPVRGLGPGRFRDPRQRRAAGGRPGQLRRGPAQRDPRARHERQRGRRAARAAARRRRGAARGAEEGRSGGARRVQPCGAARRAADRAMSRRCRRRSPPRRAAAQTALVDGTYAGIMVGESDAGRGAADRVQRRRRHLELAARRCGARHGQARRRRRLRRVGRCRG